MANYLYNRLPCKPLDGKTPYEVWCGRKPSIQHLRTFGAPAYAHVPREKRAHNKLSDRAIKLVFIGYTEGIKAYKLLDPSTRQVHYARSVIFNEAALLSSEPGKSLPAPESLDDDAGTMTLEAEVGDPSAPSSSHSTAMEDDHMHGALSEFDQSPNGNAQLEELDFEEESETVLEGDPDEEGQVQKSAPAAPVEEESDIQPEHAPVR